MARLAPDPGRDLVVGEAEVLDELLVGGGLLERVEVVAVEVLDQRLLERGGVVGLADERRDGLEADPPGRPPAALARDQLVLVVADRAHQHRLEHADLADRVGERAERLLVEVVPRLEPVRPDRRHGSSSSPPGSVDPRCPPGG